MATRWTEEEEALVHRLRGTMSIKDAAAVIGRSEQSLKSHLRTMKLGWGRWARRSVKREQIERIRQRNVVLRARTYLERVSPLGAVVSMVELVKESRAKAALRRGAVVDCPDEELLDEAAEAAGYERSGERYVVYRRKP